MLAKGARLIHRLDKYIPKGHDWSREKDAGEAAFNKLTSDPERFSVLAEIYDRNPDMKMGDPTYGFILSTFDSVKILNDEGYLRSIKTPVLMGIAGDEQVVVIGAEQRAAELMPHCRRVDLPTAKHEIWMEDDKLRKDIWLAEVDKFLIERLGLQTPAPKKPNVHRRPGM
jgi:lysophospholipase